jgi:uncharacterized protein (DUF885 family)
MMHAAGALGGAVVALFLAAAPAIATAKEPPPDKRLHALFDREFKRALDESPEVATFLGIEGYDDRLTDLSPAAVKRRKARVKSVLAELARFDPAKLNAQDRVSRRVMIDSLQVKDAFNAIYGGLPFGAGDSWMVVSPLFGPQENLSLLAKSSRFRNARDYDNYLKRLDAVPRVADQMIERMREGMRSGWMPPREAMTRVPEMLAPFAAPDVRATPLWQPFASIPDSIPAAERARIAESGLRALSEGVHPAFARLKQFVEATYLPAARAELAASRLPGGTRYYELLIRQMTTTDLKAGEIHATGLAEVKRIRAEMDKVIAATGWKGSFDEFVEFLRTDKRFFFEKPEQRLAAYRDIAKRADAELPRLFAELPRLPYGIRAMEAFEGDNFDHYTIGAMDGSRAGFFEANVNNLHKRPSWEMEYTLLHEAVPGHHLQNARAQEIQGLPLFRRTSFYVAYGEGWALYAESLGYEMGMYKDPYQRFGALSGEMLRACRLVVDTGLHAMGWSRQQAIDYLARESGLHPDVAAGEIDRYIVWPGQALGYKIGELRIKALRAKAAAALGERFDLRRFHNAVLDDGALPLTVLEARIDEWIANERKRK